MVALRATIVVFKQPWFSLTLLSFHFALQSELKLTGKQKKQFFIKKIVN